MSKVIKKENPRPRALETLARLLLASVLALPACDTGGEDAVDDGNETDTGIGTDTGTGTETDAGTNPDAGTDTDTEKEEPPYTTALVITTDYQTGAYSTIALDSHAVNQDINFINSDAVCHFDPLTGTPFVILRLGSDAVDVLDSVTFDIVKEYTVGASLNPHDIEVVSDDRAYITRYGSAEMLIVNPMTGTELGIIDLSEYADADGIPEASGMTMLDGKIYTSVSRLERENDWAPAGDSFILIIDAVTGQVSGNVKLTGTNPLAPEYSEALGKFVVAEPGTYSSLEDGVELLDPTTGTVGGFVITEEALGGSVNKTLCVSETNCYAIIGVSGDNGSNTHLVSFNPQTGQKTATLTQAAGWTYGDIALTPNGTELWLADRTTDNAGIRIFDAATNVEKTTAPIGVGLPPSGICFTR